MNKKLNLLLVSILMLSSTLLLAQYNRKQLLLEQANNLRRMRDYNLVLDIYEVLMRDYSDDLEVVDGYIMALLNLERTDEAEKALNTYKTIFPSEKYIDYSVQISLRKGEVKKGRKDALDFLAENPGKMNLYSDLASVFEMYRMNDVAIEILLKARTVAKDKNLHAYELARNYQSFNKRSEAIEEYVRHLSHNPGYQYTVNNKVKEIIGEEPKLIAELKKLVENSSNQSLKELYAVSLVKIEEYEEALIVYNGLEPQKLLSFANELAASGNKELAIQAYELCIERVDDPLLRADVGLKLADTLISSNKLEDAETILLSIVGDQGLQDRKVRYRTQANRTAREILAKLSIKKGENSNEVIKWYDEAKSFTYNAIEKGSLELQIIRYLVMLEEYSVANNRLDKLLSKEHSGSQLAKTGHYYRFILEIMQTTEASDSLLTEMIVSDPGSKETSEALFLTSVVGSMSDTIKKVFLKVYRMKSNYQELEALELIVSNESYLQNEELRILAAELAYSLEHFDLAETLFAEKYQDDTLLGYATLRLSMLKSENKESYRVVLTEFLKEHPTHVFSSYLRQMLEISSNMNTP
ncbi:MAG: hypothetical protein WC327_06420 [Candidatus Cloacimonadia bacterium]